MTDDRLEPEFENDLRATLETLMAEPAPATLRARVERTVASGQGSAPRGLRHRRAWIGVALVAAILVAIPLAISLAPRQPGIAGQASPSASAGPSPNASADASTSPLGSPSASPTGPTADQIGLPTVNLSEDVVRKTRTDTTQTGPRDGGAFTGPYIYDWPVSGTGISRITDIGGGSIRFVDSLPVGRDEVVAAFAHDSGWMAMVVTPSNLSDCRSQPTTPMPWRIEVAAMGPDGLASGAWREIASGTEASKFGWTVGTTADCAYAYPPAIALSGDLLAWSSSSSAALDAGSTVSVVSLTSAEVVASYRTATRVLSIGVSSQAVAWLEASNLLVDPAHRTWSVMEARLPSGSPAQVDIGVTPGEVQGLPDVFLDGTAVIARYSDLAGPESTVVRSDGGRIQAVTPATGTVWCSRVIAADAGRVALVCETTWTGPDGTESTPMFLAVWTAADGLRTVTVGGRIVPLPPDESVTGGWIAWYAIDFAASQNDQGTMFGDWMAIPIDSLAAPQG